MALFSKDKLLGFFKGAKKYNNQDFLLATAGICVAVAFADNDYDDSEEMTMQILMKEDDNLSAFTESEIDAAIAKNVKKFQLNPMIAKMGVSKAVRNLSGQEQKEMAVALGVAVAGADGKIDDDEIKLLKEFGSELGVNVAKFGIK